MGTGLRRCCLGIPAGARVRQRSLPLARTAPADRGHCTADRPVVLVLAWYHGDRGQQRISTPEFAILTLLLLLGGGAFWYYQRASEAKRPSHDGRHRRPTGQSPAATDARPSVAVLPFENRSREADDAFFVDGIHDDILTQLTKVGALKVIARTSVEQFRDTKLTTREIGEKLGVTKVLEGGVQRAGDRVRINVQLIDAATDAHLWAENYDRELTAANIFAIQSEVAAAIAGALKAALTPGEQARIDAIPTQNLEAWQAYQLGKQRMAKRTSAALTEAEKYFRKAITLDAKFALAWAGLARHALTANVLQRPTERRRPRRCREGRRQGAGAGPEPGRGVAVSGKYCWLPAAVRSRRTDVAPSDRAQPQLRDGAPLVEHDP